MAGEKPPQEAALFSTELKLFGGLALAWLLGLDVFLFDRFIAGRFLPPGVLTNSLECLLEASAAVVFWRSPRLWKEHRPFFWFFCLLLQADLCYNIRYYVLHRYEVCWLSFALTTLPYTLAFVVGSVALYRHVRPILAQTRRMSFVWLPLFLLIPTIFGVLLPLLYAQHRADGWSPVLAQVSFNSVFAVIFFFWSAVTLLMSLDRVYPIVGLAGIISQMGNWEGSSVYLLGGGQFGFGEFEFLWLCGIITFWYAFVVVARRPADRATEPGARDLLSGAGRRASLLVQQRMTIIGVISASFIFAVMLFRRDAGAFRIVFFGIAIGAYISLIVGELLSRQIIHYATLFGKVVGETGRDEPSLPRGEEIPVELWEVYRMAFHEDMAAQRTQAAVRRELAELAAQVAHDIRSPLAALDCVAKDVAGLSEDKRLILRSAAGRIHDIADSLIEKNRALRSEAEAPGASRSTQAPEPATRELLSSHVALLIAEKRLQFRSRSGVRIECPLASDAYGLFADLQPVEFKRVLSNLINNAVEALTGAGRVEVQLSAEDSQVLVRVRDDGRGIPPDVLGRLGGRGVTHGKAGGSGLGLHHAKTCAAAWGGSLELRSEPGQGTVATLRLPQASPPRWFVARLDVFPRDTVVVLDDDASIHQVWQSRLDSLGAGEHGVKVLSFSTAEELRAWVRADPARGRSALCLADYELRGEQATGLDLIAEMRLERSILVTGRFEEKEIVEACARLQVRMLPKILAGFVPISIRPDPA